MSRKGFTPDQFQALAQRFARQLEKKIGTGPGFAIMVWDGEKLNHVTNSRAQFAQMIGVQLSSWAQDGIASEERETAKLREAEHHTTQQERLQ